VAHDRVLLSPLLSSDLVASGDSAMALLSLAADQMSASTCSNKQPLLYPLVRASSWCHSAHAAAASAGTTAIWSLKLRPSITEREWRYKRRYRQGYSSSQAVP